MDIVVATTNQNKIRRMEALVAAVDPKIKVSNITSLNIQAPEEDGKNQSDNLLIKLNYYHNILGGNILVEDDVIELKIDNKYVSIISINSFIVTDGDQFAGWKSYFKDNGITRGRLIKCYGAIIDNEVNVEEVVIPLVVETRAERPNQNEKNILNNFIGPEAIGRTYVEMATSERDDYMQTMCLPALTKLLIK